MFLENTPRFWEKNSEIRDRIEVMTFFFFRDHYDFGRKIVKSEIESLFFLVSRLGLSLISLVFFFSLSLWPEEVQKNLYTAPCSKSLGTTDLQLLAAACLRR